MSTPILATKLYLPPPRPNAILRPHLIQRLQGGLHGKLTLISAPAGFGKTTLVSAWLAATDGVAARPVAWLSLDAADSDSTRFLTYLVAALQRVATTVSEGGVGEVVVGEGILAALQSPQPPPIDTLLTTLLNEIAALPTSFLLVLDDYHVIDAEVIDHALTFLLDHMPPQMHLVITTREDPRLPLARLRVRGQMTEVRAADLRFSPDEAARFLNEVMGLGLAAAEVSALEARTEGWIAALQLAALSLRGHSDVARFVKEFAGDNRYLVDYLVEEVLQRQPDAVRHFLLQTSMLDRLSGPLCNAVTQQEDGVAMLDALERGNLFVVPLDDSRQWFRYHHLFAEVLATRARQTQPDQLPLLHQRASLWYAEHRLPADAIRHALAAKDFALAAGQIEEAWPMMDGRFQSATWLQWAKAVPEALIATRPVLCVGYGWALLNVGDLEAGERWFLQAERWLDKVAAQDATEGMSVTDAEQFRVLPASIATARAYLAQASGDLPGSVRHGQRALELFDVNDHLRRGPAAALLGLAQWATGDLEAAYRTLAAAMAGFQKMGNLNFAISVTSGLASIRVVQGRLRAAIQHYADSLQLALAQGEPPLRGTADLYLGLSELLLEQGDLAAARQHLAQSEALGEQAGLPDWRYHLCQVHARVAECQGDWPAALAWLDEAARHYFRTPVPDLRPLAARKARVWLAQGQVGDALRWVAEAGVTTNDELSFLREFDHLTLAKILIATFATDDALRLLDRLLHAAEAGERQGSMMEIGVLQALAHQAQGNEVAALIALERVLRLAAPEGYVRLFVDEGLPMMRLLSLAAAQGIQPDFVGKLLSAFAPVALKTDAPTATLIQPLIEPLSAREVEILRLIADGLSNEEIGARLFLALSTVKGHNQNIFGKLHVQRRTEAIARARELGLI